MVALRTGPPLFARYKAGEKIGIGVVTHCDTVVEPPEFAAMPIRDARVRATDSGLYFVSTGKD